MSHPHLLTSLQSRLSQQQQQQQQDPHEHLFAAAQLSAQQQQQLQQQAMAAQQHHYYSHQQQQQVSQQVHHVPQHVLSDHMYEHYDDIEYIQDDVHNVVHLGPDGKPIRKRGECVSS